jgi:hypothetical protein
MRISLIWLLMTYLVLYRNLFWTIATHSNCCSTVCNPMAERSESSADEGASVRNLGNDDLENVYSSYLEQEIKNIRKNDCAQAYTIIIIEIIDCERYTIYTRHISEWELSLRPDIIIRAKCHDSIERASCAKLSRHKQYGCFRARILGQKHWIGKVLFCLLFLFYLFLFCNSFFSSQKRMYWRCHDIV